MAALTLRVNPSARHAPTVTTPDDRLRAARAAIGEREHLLRVKAALVPQLAAQDHIVQQRAHELRVEQADVDRLGGGVIGFLNELLGGQLSREQLEAQTAAARLREATAMRDILRDQLIANDRRIAELANAEAELELARADKEALLLATNSQIKAELDEIDIQLTSIDIELVPLHEAVVAGHAALAGLAELVKTLDEAALASPSRKRAEMARGLAGEAEARLRVFEAELSDIASFELPIPETQPGDAQLDDWVDALLKTRDILVGREDLTARIARLRARIEPVRVRHDELAARRAAMVGKRADLIANA